VKQTLLITAPFPELWRDSESVVVIDGIGLDGKVFVDDPKIDVKLVKSPEILCDVDDAEFAQFQATSEAVFQELIHELNRVHGTNHPERYWRIVCGAWFLQFAQVWYLRWKVAGEVYKQFGSLPCPRVDLDWQELLPVTHDEASLLYATDIWNHVAYAEAFSFHAATESNRSVISAPDRNRELLEYRKVINFGLPSQQAKSKLETFLSRLSPNPKVVLAGVVQTKLALVVMHLRLGVLPRLWRFTAKLTPQPVDEALRSNFLKPSGLAVNGGFRQFLASAISSHLPTVYLEGFADLVTQTQSNNVLTKPPKAIFTNTLLHRSEQFKVWCATVVSQSHTKLFSGQHGGGYGVSQFRNWSEIYEHSIVDRFFSWGAVSHDAIDAPACVQSRSVNFEPKLLGYLLVVLGPVTRQQNNFNLGNVHCNSSYYELLKSFFVRLSPEILNQVIVRPKNASAVSKPARVSLDQISQIFDETLTMDDGKSSLESQLRHCRLAVVTYNETTIPANLMANYPTIALWDSKYVRLNPQAAEIFKELEGAKILFHSPSLAAQHISNIWSDVDAWWNSQHVRNARANYCKHYAYQAKFPVLTVASAIADNL
jgi:putative transferase (TIGR04331 family)